MQAPHHVKQRARSRHVGHAGRAGEPSHDRAVAGNRRPLAQAKHAVAHAADVEHVPDAPIRADAADRRAAGRRGLLAQYGIAVRGELAAVENAQLALAPVADVKLTPAVPARVDPRHHDLAEAAEVSDGGVLAIRCGAVLDPQPAGAAAVPADAQVAGHQPHRTGVRHLHQAQTAGIGPDDAFRRTAHTSAVGDGHHPPAGLAHRQRARQLPRRAGARHAHRPIGVVARADAARAAAEEPAVKDAHRAEAVAADRHRPADVQAGTGVSHRQVRVGLPLVGDDHVAANVRLSPVRQLHVGFALVADAELARAVQPRGPVRDGQVPHGVPVRRDVGRPAGNHAAAHNLQQPVSKAADLDRAEHVHHAAALD